MTEKIVTGAVIGAIIGAAGVYLLGTKEGQKVRKQAGEAAEDTWEDLEEVFEAVIEKFDEYIKRRK